MSLIKPVSDKLQYIFDTAKVGIAICNAEYDCFELVNPAFADIHGYIPDELIGASTGVIFPPECMQRVKKDEKTLNLDIDGLSFETTHIKKDGSAIRVSVYITVIKDEHGVVKQRIANVQDISERVVLQEKNKLYTHLLDTALTASGDDDPILNSIIDNLKGYAYIYRLQPDGQESFLYLSDSAMDILGFEPQAIVNDISIQRNLMDTKELALFRNAKKKSARTMEPFYAKYTVEHPKKGKLLVESRSAPEAQPDGSIIWHGITTDITGQKRALAPVLDQSKMTTPQVSDHLKRQSPVKNPQAGEGKLPTQLMSHLLLSNILKKLDAREHELRTLTDNISDALARFDRQCRFVYVNKSFEQLMNVNIRQVYGKRPTQIPELPDTLFFDETLHRVIQTGVKESFEHKFINPDGSFRFALIDIYPEVGDDETVNYLQILSRDITRQKMTEASLSEARAKHSIVFQQSQVALTIYSIDEKVFRDVNNSFLLHTGYSKEELLNQHLSLWIDEAERDRFFKELQASKKIENFEFRYRRKDGSIRTALVSATLIQLDGELCILGENIDITERRALEKTAKKHVQVLQTLAAHLPGFIYTFKRSPDGRMSFPYAGDGIFDLYGLHPEDVSEDMAPLHDMAHADDRPLIEAAFDAAARDMKPAIFTFRVVHPEQGIKWIESRSVPEKTEDGTILWHGIMLDITEKKALQHQAELIESAISHSNDAMYILDPEEAFRFTFVNDAACRMTGYSKDELLAMTPQDLDPSMDIAHMREVNQQITSEKHASFESMHRRKDGTLFPIEHLGYEIHFGGKPLDISIVRDITERKADEEQLLLKEFALDKIDDAVYLIGEDSIFRYVNEEACRGLGYSKEELLTLGVIHIDPNVPMQEWKKLWNNIKDIGTSTIVTEHKRKDGTLFPVEITSSYFEYQGVQYTLGIARDITERKRIDADIARLNVALDSVRDGAILVSITGQIHYVNESLVKMLGYTRDDLLASSLFEIAPDLKAEHWADRWQKIVEGGGNTLIETRNRTKDGRSLPVEIAITIFEIDGQAYNIALVRDITERQQMEQEVEDSHNFLNQILNSISDPIFVKDQKHSWVLMNDAFSKMIGQPRELLLGKSDYDFLPKEQADVFWEKDEAVFKSCQINVNEEYITATDGSIHFIQTSKSPFTSAKEDKYLVGVIRDISERKQNEEQLKETERKFRTLAENSPDLIIRYDKELRRTYANPAWEQLNSVSANEVIGKTLQEKTVFTASFENQKELYIKNLQHVIFTGEAVNFDFSSAPMPDGEQKHFIISFVPEFNDEGHINGVLAVGRDISSRKQDQKILEQRELELRTLTDNLPDNIARWDTKGRYLYINPTYERTIGMPASEVLGKSIVDLVPEHTMAINAISRVAETGKGEMSIFQPVRSANGKTRIHEIKFIPEKNTQGEVVSILGLGRDVTANKVLEKALRQREREFRTLAENSPDVIVRYDRELRRIYVNPAWKRVNSITTSEIIGKTPAEKSDIIAPFAASYEANLRAAMETGVMSTVELNMQDKQGAAMVFEQRIVTEHDQNDRVTGVLTIARDITERKQMEVALEKRELEFRTLAENIPDPVFRYDLEGRRVYVNPEVERCTGLTAADLVGKNASEKRIVVQGDDLKVLQCIRTVVQTGKPVEEEFLFPAPDGRMLWFKNTHVPEFAPDGTIQGVLAIAHDVTAVKQQTELTTQLKESQERYRDSSILLQSVLESSPDLITFALDRNYRYVAFNSAHKGVMRSIWGKDIALDMDMLEVISSDGDREAAKRNFDRALCGENFVLEETYGEESLSRLYWQIYYAPIYSDNGEVTGLTCFNLNITERQRMQEALLKREQEFRTLTEKSPDTIARYDKECIRLYANAAFAEISGVSAEALIGRKPSDLNATEQAFIYEEKIKKVFETGIETDLEYTWPDKKGRMITSHIRIVPERDAEGTVATVIATGRDITKLKEHEARLNEAQKMAKIGSWELTFPGLQLFWSDEIYNIFEMDPKNVEPSYDHFLNAIHPEDRELVDTAYAQSLNNKTEYEIAHRLLMSDGRIKYVQEKGNTVYRPDGTPLRSIGTVQDLTKEKNTELKIEHISRHDFLTGLPNHLMALEIAEQSIARAMYTKRCIGFLYIDLDEFKKINDSLGHSVGDKMLQDVAFRLNECLREGDTISRQGGDEFLIILSDINDKSEIVTVAEEIIKTFEKPFLIDSHTFTISASVGIALYPNNSDSFESLLKNADVAMYKAKESGKNNYCFYTQEMSQDLVEQLQLLNDLENAIKNGEFVLHYQPQINLAHDGITGAEALIRWEHPERGLIPPLKFIPLAESSGMIVQIGRWVLQEACRQAALWHKQGMRITMAVNISAVQFKRGNLEAVIEEALDASGLNPQFLELELTESILINDEETVFNTIKKFKDMGIQLSIDDFGTGYSSLSYLKRFNVDKLKIDQSFVKSMLQDKDHANIVKTIIQMARDLNLKSIAEGVEDNEILELIDTFGCDEAQGYHFAKPLKAGTFEIYYTQYGKKDLK